MSRVSSDAVMLSAQSEPGNGKLPDKHPVPPRAGRGARLTGRERDVMRLLALGATTTEVAAELGIATETVRSHARNATRKTGARTRAQLVAIELARELIDT